MRKRRHLFGLVILFGLILSACGGSSDAADGAISASGTIAAVEVNISPELGGKVLDVSVDEGDLVQAGDVLFSLEGELLAAQARQAEAAVDLTQASLDAAQLQHQAALVQVDLVMQGARFQDRQQRKAELLLVQPEVFDLPAWYFDDAEAFEAAKSAVSAAEEKLGFEKDELAEVLAAAGNQDFLDAERKLIEAQVMFLSAKLAYQQTQALKVEGEKEYLVSAAQKSRDSAKAELEARQIEYDRILSSASAEDVLEARARAAAAQLILDNTHDQLDNLQTGEYSLQVEAALIAAEQADAAVKQAEAGLAQAEAAMDLLHLQMEKTAITAPAPGTILSVSLDAGEVVGPGSVVMVLGQMDEVTLTVYVSEEQYGRVRVGQGVSVTVDSFPQRVFTGVVRYIADQAEFTPRNVQTTESRKTTVYAIKISLMNLDQSLKPGMSADVIFN